MHGFIQREPPPTQHSSQSLVQHLHHGGFWMCWTLLLHVHVHVTSYSAQKPKCKTFILWVGVQVCNKWFNVQSCDALSALWLATGHMISNN